MENKIRVKSNTEIIIGCAVYAFFFFFWAIMQVFYFSFVFVFSVAMPNYDTIAIVELS